MASSTHPEVELISRSTFAFSNALHEQLKINGDGGNLVYSPFSLGLVLLMARFGARGSTAEQLDGILNPTDNTTKKLEDLRPLRRGFFRVLKTIEDDQSGDGNVTVANRMFTGTGFNVKDEFKKVSRATLGIKVKQLNFTENQGSSAAEVINSWVANKTNGKIDGIISSDSLRSQTQVILVNTIHLKSPWQIPFDPEKTRAATFYSNPNNQIEVAMMTSEDRYAYGNLPELNATVVVLPYKGGRYSMHIYVPNQLDGLDGFLDALKNATIAQIRSKIRQPGTCEIVRLAVPKFKIESEFQLVEPLRKMGAVDMFSSTRANFTGVSEDVNLYVSDIIQKAFITVDEHGTEAAAASGIKAGFTCIPTITNVAADRPFYFQIMDEQHGVILFAGTVRKPSVVAKVELLARIVQKSDEYDEYTVDIPFETDATSLLSPSSISPTANLEATPSGTNNEDLEPKLVFATFQSGIKAYSEATETVTTIVNITSRNFTGVAWDPVQRQLYFCGQKLIYKATLGSNKAQVVFTAPKYGALTGLAFEWITGNLYGVTEGGYILACNTTAGRSLICATILSGQGHLYGIALHSDHGTMYWTGYSHYTIKSTIMKANLDGTNRRRIAAAGDSGGIVIDYSSSRLIWADYSTLKSSDLDGGDIRRIGSLPSGARPWGVAVHNGKLFWSDRVAHTVQSSEKNCRNIKTVYTGAMNIKHLTSMEVNVSSSRRNDCAGNQCENVCVLAPTGFRCL